MSAKARGSVWFRFRVAMAKQHEFDALLAAHLRPRDEWLHGWIPPPGCQPLSLAARTKAKLNEARQLLVDAEAESTRLEYERTGTTYTPSYLPASSQVLQLAMFMAVIEERS